MGDILKEILGHALGTVINPVLEYLDVNGVVKRIEIDDLAQRIDANAIVDKIDINKLLDRVDINRQLQRVDINALMQRVDVNELVRRSDVSLILAESTTGIFTPVLDAIRTQIVDVDLFLIRMTRFRMRDHKGILPPRPGVRATRDEREYYPKGRMNKAIAVQGRYTGFCSKASAIFLDTMFVTVLFALIAIVIKLSWMLFLGTSEEEAEQKVSRENFWIFVLYCIFWFLYFCLAILPTGQTFGMVIIGIKLRNCKGPNYFSGCQAVVRTLLLPLSLTVMPLLGAIGFFRRDGRMLHDIVAGTGLVYAWDARMAKERRKAEIREEQMQYEPPETSSSETDPLSPFLDEDPDTSMYSTFGISTTDAKPADKKGSSLSGNNESDLWFDVPDPKPEPTK